jgi:hypothetical protein
VLLSKASEKMVAQFNPGKPHYSKCGATPNAPCQVPKPPSRIRPNRQTVFLPYLGLLQPHKPKPANRISRIRPNRGLAEYLLGRKDDESAMLIIVIICLSTFAIGYATGGAAATWAITFVSFAVTGPGFLYERLSREKVTKAKMFLVDVAFWLAVIGMLKLCHSLKVWPVLIVMGLSALTAILANKTD